MLNTRFLTPVIGFSVALVLACGGGDDDDSSSAQPTQPAGQGAATQPAPTQAAGSQVTPAATSASSGTSGLVAAYGQVRSYRLTVVNETTGQPAQTTNIEVMLPDRQRVQISQGGVAVEVIVIGNDTYYKLGPAPWTRQAGAGSAVQTFDTRSIGGLVQGLQTAGGTRGGTATVEGKTCQIYTLASPGAATQEYCIADNLPLRIVTQAGPLKTTMTFKDYNANIDIRAPI